MWASPGQTYWAFVVDPNANPPGVPGSRFGGRVDPSPDAEPRCAVVFTSKDKAHAYATRFPQGAPHIHGVVRQVLWLSDGVLSWPKEGR